MAAAVSGSPFRVPAVLPQVDSGSVVVGRIAWDDRIDGPNLAAKAH